MGKAFGASLECPFKELLFFFCTSVSSPEVDVWQNSSSTSVTSDKSRGKQWHRSVSDLSDNNPSAIFITGSCVLLKLPCLNWKRPILYVL